MLKNVLKIAIRNLFKNKIYVFINIIGLGLALACCIVAYTNSKFNWDFDKHHTNIDNIYKIHSLRDRKGDLTEYGIAPMPMAKAINNDLVGADAVFRYESHTFTVRDKQLDKVFDTRVCYADSGFLESFTFVPIGGDMRAYHKLDEAVVTATYARKFYGEENPLGKILTVFDDTGMSFNFVITGLVEEAPQNSSVNFEILLGFENRFRMYDENVKGNWGVMAQNTFVYFNDPAQVKSFEPLLDKYISIQNESKPDFEISKFELTPMSSHAHRSRDIRWDNLRNALPTAATLTPQIMAILILLVACFNFTNTAIANSNRRLKEIGVRKVLGGSRVQLIKQFMIENLTICAVALLLSICISIYLVPAYGAMWEGMDLKIDFSEDFGFYLFLIGLLVFTTVLAGLYPSLYISKYRPVRILRGNTSIGATGLLSKVLLALQYTFTVIAIFASIAFIQNARYQDTLDLGYNRDQVIGISLLNNTQYEKIYASIIANPAIESVATAKNHIGRGDYGLQLKNQGIEIDADMLDVGIGYLETMGLKAIEGRVFSKGLEASDSKNSLVVNEKLVEAFGWEDAIGQRVAVNDSTTLTVVGVVKDFYMYGFWAPIEPVGIRLENLKFQDNGTYSYIAVKTNIKDVHKVYDYLEQEWNSKIPNKTFAGFYQNDLMKEAKDVNDNILTIFGFLGIVAFLLSCLGLFTLVSINLIRKTKEIGVRKVLGSSVASIVFLISRGYFVLLFISSILGVIAGYYLIDELIASIFTNYKSVDIYTFAIPIIVITSISITIASLRTLQAAVANPIQSLRYE